MTRHMHLLHSKVAMMVVETTVALMHAVNSDGNFNNKLVFVKQITTAQVVAMMVVVEIFANGTRAGSKQ